MDPQTAQVVMWIGATAAGFCVALLILAAGHAVLPHLRSDAYARAGDSRQTGLMRWLVTPLGRILEAPRWLSLRNYVAAPYAGAGRPGQLSDAQITAVALLLGFGLTVFLLVTLGALLEAWALAAALLGFPAGMLGTVASLKSQAELRKLRIRQLLPYALDLLVLVLRSGTSFTMAMRQVVTDYRDHPLGEEFGTVLSEIELGAQRQTAFNSLVQRVPIDEMRAFADNVVQSEELGWPLADTLERLATRIASQRILNAQSAAGQASVMIMMPSSLILMAVVLLMFGPIIVRILRHEYAL